jgi:hypothetical protein
MVKFSVSERFACKVLGQHRSAQRKKPQSRPDEEELACEKRCFESNARSAWAAII